MVPMLDMASLRTQLCKPRSSTQWLPFARAGLLLAGFLRRLLVISRVCRERKALHGTLQTSCLWHEMQAAVLINPSQAILLFACLGREGTCWPAAISALRQPRLGFALVLLGPLSFLLHCLILLLLYLGLASGRVRTGQNSKRERDATDAAPGFLSPTRPALPISLSVQPGRICAPPKKNFSDSCKQEQSERSCLPCRHTAPFEFRTLSWISIGFLAGRSAP